jgi:hypothetical protein
MHAGFRIRHVLAVAWILGLTVQAAPVQADGETDALVHEGVELRRSSRDAEALAVFERALAIDGSPRTRAQVGLAEQALGLWVEAERDLDAAIAEGNGAWFDQHASALRAAEDTVRAHLASLRLTSNVVGAEVRVNRVVAGVTPIAAPLRVVAGAAVVEVRAPHFAPRTVALQLAPGSSANEVIDLEPLAASSGLPGPAHDPTPPDSAAEPPSLRPGPRPGAWVALGGGIVFLGTAALAWTFRNSSAALYDDDSRCFYGGLTRDARCGNYRSAADAAQAVSIVAMGTAIAAFSLSTVLFLHPSRAAAARGIPIRCSAGASLRCSTDF